MSERRLPQIDTREHLSVINHYNICWAMLGRHGQHENTAKNLNDVLERETTLHPNNASLILIFSQMATVGFNMYGEGSREASYEAYQQGMALAMDVTDSICDTHGLSAIDVRNKIVTRSATRKDLGMTDETNEEDARRALSEAILRMGEEAMATMDSSYDDLVRHVSSSLGVDPVATRHFIGGFGLLFDSSLGAVADGLALKHHELDYEVESMTAGLDAEIQALLEADL